jgi:hypothetical protein
MAKPLSPDMRFLLAMFAARAPEMLRWRRGSDCFPVCAFFCGTRIYKPMTHINTRTVKALYVRGLIINHSFPRSDVWDMALTDAGRAATDEDTAIWVRGRLDRQPAALTS